MIVKRLLVLILLMNALHLALKAQKKDFSEPVFVSMIEGTVEVRSNSTAWERVTLRTRLNTQSELRINSKGKITLLKNGGFHLTVKRDEYFKWTVNQLSFEEDNSFIGRLIDMFLAGISREDVVKGTITTKGPTAGSYPMLVPAGGEIIKDTLVTFRWLKDNRQVYHFQIIDADQPSKPIVDKTMSADTSYVLKDARLLVVGRRYRWTIMPLLARDEPIFVDFVLGENNPSTNINGLLDDINRSTWMDQDMKKVLTILCYKEQGAYTKAQNIFLKALAESPNSLLLQQYYTFFVDDIVSHNIGLK